MSEKRCFIEVTELRAIQSDANQWMLMKRTKKTDKATGKPTGGYSDWYSYKYYPEYERAAEALARELVRMSGANTFPELLRNAEKIHKIFEEIHDAAVVKA